MGPVTSREAAACDSHEVAAAISGGRQPAVSGATRRAAATKRRQHGIAAAASCAECCVWLRGDPSFYRVESSRRLSSVGSVVGLSRWRSCLLMRRCITMKKTGDLNARAAAYAETDAFDKAIRIQQAAIDRLNRSPRPSSASGSFQRRARKAQMDAQLTEPLARRPYRTK